MAENTVVKEQLTGAMVDAGAALTAKLDEIGLPVTSALWLFEPDLNEWRLLFASPEVSSKGPRDVYEKIRLAIDELGPKAATIPLSVVGLLDPDADLVRLLKVAIRTGPGVNRIRFSKNVINGHFIDDALIYRAA
ncbi:MAG: hypothetical protein HYU27_09935 [Acidobacteria bacterium]|nr:hypothetical protein [Acidobacteriota bacterium]